MSADRSKATPRRKHERDGAQLRCRDLGARRGEVRGQGREREVVVAVRVARRHGGTSRKCPLWRSPMRTCSSRHYRGVVRKVAQPVHCARRGKFAVIATLLGLPEDTTVKSWNPGVDRGPWIQGPVQRCSYAREHRAGGGRTVPGGAK
jgi:hypothetical protein